MTQISIQRWHNRYRSAHPLSRPHVDEWDAAMADLDLDGEVDGYIAEDEWIFIRRLDIRARLRDDAGAVSVRELWRQALSQGLRAALEQADPNNLLRYRDRRDALADLLYRAAQRDDSRRWAFVQGGLLPLHVTDHQAVLRHALLRLQDQAAAIWPLLARLMTAEEQTGVWTALVRTAADDLRDVIAHCPQTRSFVWAEVGPLATAKDVSPPVRSEIGHALIRWCATHAALALENRKLLAAILAAAEHPASVSLSRTLAAAYVGQAEQAIAEAARHTPPQQPHRSLRARDEPGAAAKKPTAPVPPSPPWQEMGSESPAEETVAQRPGAKEPRRNEPPPLPELPECARVERSEWAGLLYLLNLIPASGLLRQAQELESSPATLLLWMAAELWKTPRADPALRAFCGGPDSESIDNEAYPTLTAEEQNLCRAAGQAIEAELRRRLPDLSASPLPWLCRREARIRFEPGWIDVYFRLNQADSRIRRVALDLDPGWLPWLGCVVRFIYE